MGEYSGGCQCGAVRFHVSGTLEDASICHCRMCQKAFGAYYAPLVSTRGATLTWTRGQPTPLPPPTWWNAASATSAARR